MHKLCVLEVDNTEYKIPEKVINSYQKLQLENKQLKVEIECFEKSSEIKDYNIVEQQEKIVSLTIERDKYKNVINKIREYTNDKLFDDYTYCSYEDLKQNIEEILDKANVKE